MSIRNTNEFVGNDRHYFANKWGGVAAPSLLHPSILLNNTPMLTACENCIFGYIYFTVLIYFCQFLQVIFCPEMSMPNMYIFLIHLSGNSLAKCWCRIWVVFFSESAWQLSVWSSISNWKAITQQENITKPPQSPQETGQQQQQQQQRQRQRNKMTAGEHVTITAFEETRTPSSGNQVDCNRNTRLTWTTAACHGDYTTAATAGRLGNCSGWGSLLLQVPKRK